MKVSVENTEHVGSLEYVFQVPESPARDDLGRRGDPALADQIREARLGGGEKGGCLASS